MSSIEGSPTGRIVLDGPEMQHRVMVIDIESDAQRIRQAFRDHYPEIAQAWVDVDFNEVEQRVAAMQEGMFGMEEMKRMAMPIALGPMLLEQLAEAHHFRPGTKTKPPERFTWKDKDPGRAKAKAARKQNKKRRQK